MRGKGLFALPAIEKLFVWCQLITGQEKKRKTRLSQENIVCSSRECSRVYDLLVVLLHYLCGMPTEFWFLFALFLVAATVLIVAKWSYYKHQVIKIRHHFHKL